MATGTAASFLCDRKQERRPALHLSACERRRKPQGAVGIEMESATAGDSILQATLLPVITALNHDLRLLWAHAPGSTPASLAGQCSEPWHAVFARSD